jgi:WD40 repeat protein
MQLASISDNLKVWVYDDKLQSLSLQASYQPPVDQLYSMAWNHTNQVIAVGGREPKINLVQSINGQFLHPISLSDSKFSSLKIRAVAFSNNSRDRATTVNSPIQLWDLKKRQVKSVFVGHQQNVVSLAFNSQGNLYSADEIGQIWLWNVKNQEVIQKMEDTMNELTSVVKNAALSCMQLSGIAPLLAAGFDDGSIKVWDCNTSSLVRKQRSHSDQLSAFSFSSKNNRLIATVGFDEKLQLIDINLKSTDVCATVDVEQKLTATSFHEDGIHTAVGTIDGQILVYDWRNVRRPVVMLNAHDPHPVRALTFQVSFRLLFHTYFILS